MDDKYKIWVKMPERTPVLISGLGEKGKGQMSLAVLNKMRASEEFEILPYGLTAEDTSSGFCDPRNNQLGLSLIRPSELEAGFGAIKRALKGRGGVAVDFSVASAILSNAQYSTRLGLLPIIGTSGGDVGKLDELARESGVHILYAPNMASAVVSVKYNLEDFAARVPLGLCFCEGSVWESHQRTKDKTSATAKDIVALLNTKLGVRISEADITKIRKPEEQLRMGVAQEFLDGQGWHSYFLRATNAEGAEQLKEFSSFLWMNMFCDTNPALKGYSPIAQKPYLAPAEAGEYPLLLYGWGSPNSDVFVSQKHTPGELTLVHNVNGRGPYADGTIFGARVQLARQARKEPARASSMVDALYKN